ncbi:MAG: hypothetical protein M3296_07220, partial [Actinomycetota bacterium]|nr:hypothetical protein [Actinomycetota bacterium]
MPIAATGLLGLLGSLGLPVGKPATPAPAPVVTSVSPPVVASAASVRGTMIMLHGGGWTGPDRYAQENLVEQPGRLLVEHGWRVVSVDYHAGQSGLQDVLDAAGAELAGPSGRLLCLYGESSGAHLALVAAARLRAVDCVAAVGVPTDLEAYRSEVGASGDFDRRRVADLLDETFGSTPDERAPWEPVRIAGDIDADLLLMHQSDDHLVLEDQVQRLLAVRPTTEAVELEGGDPATPGDPWLHGTLSGVGRAHYVGAIGDFVDRVAADYRTARAAARLRCAGVNRRLARTGLAPLRRA